MRKRKKKRGPVVCLLSHHPLVLGEFERLLDSAGFALRRVPLDTSLPAALRNAAVPPAQTYVVDALAARPATEALVAGIVEKHPGARVLVVAEKFNAANSFPLLHLGAKALLIYAEARQRLAEAVANVAAGGFWVPRALMSGFVETVVHTERSRRAVRSSARLSRREKEVLDALLENQANKEIAGHLHISERTAKFHVSNLLQKFGVRRRADLILMCIQEGSPYAGGPG